MRRDPFNGQAVQSFYLVTPFWNLKRALAPSTRCYYHGYRQRQCPLPPHTRANRQSDCGSGTATAIDGCQSSQMVWGPEACPGGASRACHRKLGPSWPRISLPSTATTLRTIHVARNQTSS